MGKKSLHLYQGWPTFFPKPPILFKPSSYPLHKRKTSKFHSVVEWLKHRTDDQHGLSSKPTCEPFCCVVGKDTLRHFPLLGGLDKQF